jgi:hypothetical protein
MEQENFQDYESVFLEEEKKPQVVTEVIYPAEKLQLPKDNFEKIEKKIIETPVGSQKLINNKIINPKGLIRNQNTARELTNHQKYLIATMNLLDDMTSLENKSYKKSRTKFFTVFAKELKNEFNFSAGFGKQSGFQRYVREPLFKELLFFYRQDHDPGLHMLIGFLFYIKFRSRIILETYKVRDERIKEYMQPTPLNETPPMLVANVPKSGELKA